MATNTERELLEMLVKKVSEAKALNGGFDKLFLMIEHIHSEQDKSGKKLDKVSEALYDPDDGLFSRVKGIETKLDTNISDLEDKCKDVPTVKNEIDDLKKFQAAVESIAGKQLEELGALVKLRKNLSMIYWALMLSIAAFVGNLLFQLSKHT